MAGCLHCGNALPPRIGKGGKFQFCTVKCRARHWYLIANPRPPRPCKRCGIDLPAGAHTNRDYCSRACKKAVDLEKWKETYHRKYKTDLAYRDRFQRIGHVRRARIRGVTLERFSPLAVLERDGWTCQICGVPTPKELRGLKVSNAPTLDHIVPVARGGAHSMANTRCACLRCNTSKGSKLMGAA